MSWALVAAEGRKGTFDGHERWGKIQNIYSIYKCIPKNCFFFCLLYLILIGLNYVCNWIVLECQQYATSKVGKKHCIIRFKKLLWWTVIAMKWWDEVLTGCNSWGLPFTADTQRNRVSPHHDAPFAKTRHCGDIYPDRHLLVEIHLHDKICRLWTQRKRWRYILSPSPLICPQQASKIKSSLYIIHCTEAAQIGPL